MLQLQNAMTSRATEDDILELQPVERRVVELPLEIHYHIIGCLNNAIDAATIVNCALVCRQWLPFSLSKLYQSVTLNYQRQWMSFKHIVLRPPSSIRRYLPRVRELYVWVRDENYFDEKRKQPRFGWGKGQERPWSHDVLNQCAIQLDGLTSIYLKNFDWSRAPDSSLSCGSNYRSLTTLELRYAIFANVGQLDVLVTAFPTLDDLRLHWIILQSPKPLQVSHDTKAGYSLTRLQLQCVEGIMAAVSLWLARAQLVQNLTILEWGYGSQEDWKTVSEAIDAHCPQTLLLVMPRDWQGLGHLL